MSFALFTLIAITFIGIVTYFVTDAISLFAHEKSKRQFRQTILSRVSAGIDVTNDDVERFGSAHNLKGGETKRILDRMYSEVISDEMTPETVAKLRQILKEGEISAPFETLPDEVRLSMVRVWKSLSSQGEDSSVLTPITNALNEYGALKARGRGQKKREIFSILVGVVGLAVAVTSLLLTPSDEDLAAGLVEKLVQLRESPQILEP